MARNEKIDTIPQVRQATRAQTAEFFGVSLPTLDGWVRRGCPLAKAGKKGVASTFDLLAVAEWRFKKVNQFVDVVCGLDPESMPPRERKEWWSGEEIRLRTEEARRRLMPIEVVSAIVGNALSGIRAKLLGHHNTIASLYPEIPTDAIREIQRLNKEALEELSNAGFPDELRESLEQLFDDDEAAGGNDGQRMGG